MRILTFLCFSLFGCLLNAAPIKSASSGMWSNPNVWVGGTVPSTADDVQIGEDHMIIVDLFPIAPDSVVALCRSLTVDEEATLKIGYSNLALERILQITGDIVCNGTIASGRMVPQNGSSGDGSIYSNNSSLWLCLSQPNTLLTGKGYLHPKNLLISNKGQANFLSIDHYNIVLDGDLTVASEDSLDVQLAHNSYLQVLGSIGICGGNYQSASPDYTAFLTVSGLLICNNLNLFTKNPEVGSAIELIGEGILTAQQITAGPAAPSSPGGFSLNIEENAIFRCGMGSPSPVDYAKVDPNLSVTNQGDIKIHFEGHLSSGAEVLTQIAPFMADSCNQPVPVRDVVGCSHIAGWYNFTDDPFLLEGMERMKQWGSTTIKTTISPRNEKMFSAYPFNHTWPAFQRLSEVVMHPMMDSLFSDPYFTTHTFWAPAKNPTGRYKEGPDRNHAYFLDTEEQVYEAARYLLQTYGHLEKKFLFQNWEGDWMLRGSNRQWESDPSSIPDDIWWQIEGMARMWRAYMRGIERASEEFPNAKASILYAVEFNKLFRPVNGQRKTMMEIGVPCLIADVIPKVRMHLSSWSAYDGNFDEPATNRPFPTGLCNGLEIAAYYTNSTKGLAGIPVQIGEFGMNENPPYQSLSDSEIRLRYDQVAGLVSSMGIPYVYIWNLYGSGQQSVSLEKGVQYAPSYLYQVLDGKWIIEPDGSFGVAAQFLKNKYFDCQALTSSTGENETPPFQVHPNPSAGRIFLDFGMDEARYHILDPQGKIVFQDQYHGAGWIDISHLSEGLYILDIRTADGRSGYAKLLLSK